MFSIEGRRVNEEENERMRERERERAREGEKKNEKGENAWQLDLHVHVDQQCLAWRLHVLFTHIYIDIMQDQFHSITSSTAASVLSVIEDDMTRPQPILLRTSTLKVFFSLRL